MKYFRPGMRLFVCQVPILETGGFPRYRIMNLHAYTPTVPLGVWNRNRGQVTENQRRRAVVIRTRDPLSGRANFGSPANPFNVLLQFFNAIPFVNQSRRLLSFIA